MISERKYILENKENSTSINIKKANTWTEIANIFNVSYPTDQKKAIQLKDIYKRLKMKARKNATVRKQSALQTGGGPPVNQVVSEIDQQLEQIDPDLTAEFSNDYDDDRENSGNISYVNINDSNLMPCSSNSVPLSSNVVTVPNNAKPSPSTSKSSFSTPSFPKKSVPQPFHEEVEKMARKEHEAKMRILGLQEEILKIKLERLKGIL